MIAVISAIAPVFFIAAVAYGLRRKFALDARTLTTLNIYLFIPTLVFDSLSHQDVRWALFGRFLAAHGLFIVCMTVVMISVARMRKFEGVMRNAFLLTMFMNLANFGLPVAKFGLGEEGLLLAVVSMVCGNLFQTTAAIYFALRSHHQPGRALLYVFRFPMLYAFVLALVFQRTGWTLPPAVARAVGICAEAAIPLQLMILGVQLAESRLQRHADVFLAAGLRLCLGPLLALALIPLAGLSGLSARVFILQMSGPVAVAMGVYAVQFNVKPGFVASVVAWSSIFSLVTVAVVLYFLRQDVAIPV